MQKFLFDRPDILGDVRSPVIVSPDTLFDQAASLEVLEKVIAVAKQLTSDPFTFGMIDVYERGERLFGARWKYVDILCALYAVAKLGEPTHYLEIGTRRGRSAAMVAAASPTTHMVCADLWQRDYASNDNPGPEFVTQELRRVGLTGALEFLSGDSHQTIPAYFRDHPNQRFDLITVDGDHSLAGAMDDLINVAPHLTVGGVLVFDDIDNPYCPGLAGVWNEFLAKHPEFVGTTRVNPLGFGVGIAIRLFETVPTMPQAETTSKGWRAWLGQR
jgi:predicted O-methyltransferase YrrM